MCVLIRLASHYEVVSDDDRSTGSSNSFNPVLGRFSDERVAREYARGKGGWGQDASVFQRGPVDAVVLEDDRVFLLGEQVFKDASEIQTAAADKLKAAALAKLTPQERAALGF